MNAPFPDASPPSWVHTQVVMFVYAGRSRACVWFPTFVGPAQEWAGYR